MDEDMARNFACSCGSTEVGLVFIPDEGRYQCANCIYRVYAALAEISKITLDEDPLQGVKNMNNLRQAQDKTLFSLSESFETLSRQSRDSDGDGEGY